MKKKGDMQIYFYHMQNVKITSITNQRLKLSIDIIKLK